MLSLISSIAFTNIIYLIIGKCIINKNNNDLKSYSETAILGFTYLSLVALFLNFFSALNPIINSIILISLIIIFFLKKSFLSRKEIFFSLLLTFFGFFLILFDTVNRPDAGLYHLPFIKILNEEKIIFGLFNLHARFGHVSILQYSSALNNNIFLGEVGILIPLLSIYSFLTFYFLADVCSFLFNKKNQKFNFTSIYFSSLILLYISYKINRYSEFGNDAIGHLLFFYLISKLINFNNIDYQNFKRIYLISVFTILNKFTLIFSILIPAYYFLKNKISFKKTLLSLPTFFLILWMIRNIITSGCLIYPQTSFCFVNLNWSNEDKIISESLSAEAWSKDWPNRIDTSISMEKYNKNFNWLSSWMDNHFKIVANILTPYFVVLLLIISYFKYKNKKKTYFKNIKLPLLISLIGSSIFFIKFPIYRYGYSYLISSIILISVLLIKHYDSKKIKKLSIFVLFIFLISFTYKQTQRYIKFYDTRVEIPKFYNDEIKYKKIKIKDNSYYNLTLNSLCMYDINLCTPYINNQLTMKVKYSYKFFTSK